MEPGIFKPAEGGSGSNEARNKRGVQPGGIVNGSARSNVQDTAGNTMTDFRANSG
jgi:hypothetical protein